MKKTLYIFCCLVFFFLPLDVKAAQALTLVEIDGLFGFADEAGELVIPAIYTSAEPFSEDGFALVSRDIQENGWPYEHGFINQNGVEVVALQYQQLSQFVEGFAVAQQDGKFGYISNSGNVAIDFIYSEASVFDGGKAVVKLDGEVLVIDRPDWEDGTLPIEQSVYVSFSEPSEYLAYFYEFMDGVNVEQVNESDILALELFFASLLRQMDILDAEVQGTSIMATGEDYADVVARSKVLYTSFSDVFSIYGLEQSENIQGYMNLIYQGISNVQTNGVSIPLNGAVNYEVIPFPVPYFDESIYSNFTTSTQFSDYLSQCLRSVGSKPYNASGSEGLVDYVNYTFIYLESLHLTSYFNTVTVGKEKQEEFFKDRYDLSQKINDILTEFNVTLPESTSKNILILVDNNDLNKNVKFKIYAKALSPYLSQIDGLRIIVGNQGQGVYLSSNDLATFFETRDILTFEVLYGNGVTTLSLYDTDNKTKVNELPASIFLIVPAESETTTVYALLAGREGQSAENWGGLFKLNNTIEFATSFAGEYITREARANISDIEELSFEQQEQIHFMVSKGFFRLSGNDFLPEEPMTRVEFITALVKLFFAQDSEAISYFSDVSIADPDYALISAAYQEGITSGYEDNTFRGSDLINREELISFLAKTLESNKGYVTLNDPQETVSVFSDSQAISEWAVENVALALEHGIIPSSDYFAGDSEVSRKEVASLLYALFLELYDTPDNVLILGEFYSVKEGSAMPIWPIVLAVVILLTTFFVFFVRKKLEAKREFDERMKRAITSVDTDLEDTTIN